MELLLQIIPAAVTMLLGWLLGRRQQVAQTRTTELDNVEKALEIWRKMTSDLEEKLNAAIARNDILEQELDEAKAQIASIIANCPSGCPAPRKITRITPKN